MPNNCNKTKKNIDIKNKTNNLIQKLYNEMQSTKSISFRLYSPFDVFEQNLD